MKQIPAGHVRLDVGERSVDLAPGRRVTIGRGLGCDVVVDDLDVSREHAVVHREGGRWVLRDLGTSNGTWLEGRPCDDAVDLAGLRRRAVHLGGARGVRVRATVGPDVPGPPGEDTDASAGSLTLVGGRTQALPPTGAAVTLGRGRENTVVVPDLLASRRHARLVPHGGGYLVEDLSSSNGTYVNGARIGRAVLEPGDLLTIGRARFELRGGRLEATQDAGDISFRADHLGYTLDDGTRLLDDVSFDLPGSRLVAVIGPSGAGKSTLLKALIGEQRATAGAVTYDGRDLYSNFDDLRHRIGVVPQDDVVHGQLTVRQALTFAAELRFASDVDAAERTERVEQVMRELELQPQAGTRVARLSGGQRKRTSVALELLTRPSLLFLDEPTSGLDPGLDKLVMLMLRELADDGRTVVVITHSVASLRLCDDVLLLAPGGKMAYFGPPAGVARHFGTDDYADVFTAVSADADAAQERFRRTRGQHPDEPVDPRPTTGLDGAREPGGPPSSARRSVRQLSTLVRRQAHVIRADRGLVGFLLALPLALAALAALVPGNRGLSTAHPRLPGDLARPEATQIMTILVMGALFMGLSASIREPVAERAIFLRERAVGLSTFAYLASKVVVHGVIVALQCAVMVALVVAVHGPPDTPVVLADAVGETYLMTVLVGLTAVSIGLALSSLARTADQVMPMLVIAIMASLVFSGGLFGLESSAMRAVAGVFPSRWGLALGAQTADVAASANMPGIPSGPRDPRWERDPGSWLSGAGIIAVQFVAAFAVAWWASRRRVTR